MAKAGRRVRNVLRAFRLIDRIQGAKVLDVGCGLGYYTQALSVLGAAATGIDYSETGVEVARATFPECRFQCASWPDGVERDESFDIIWAVDFSVINTFDIQVIKQRFVEEALERLTPGGCIVVGWSTNLSGLCIGNWSHWSVSMLGELGRACGFSQPQVAEAQYAWSSCVMIQVGRAIRRSLPIFMIRRKPEL